MMQKTRTKNSPALKRRIIDHVLSRIVGGDWQPGCRLPTRVEFEKEFSTTAVTVNRAFEPLIKDGFLMTAGKNGTYVSSSPPHLNNFAVVYPVFKNEESTLDKSAFYDCVRLAEKQIKEQFDIQFTDYNDFSASPGNQAYQQLLDDIRNHRLAGVFFSHWPDLDRTPLMRELNIPAVAICSRPCPGNVLAIGNPLTPILDKAIENFKLKGRKKAALLSPPVYHSKIEEFRQKFASAGIELSLENIQFIDLDYHWTVEYSTELLFSQSRQSLPDCLFIADDNLVAPAIDGIITAAGAAYAKTLNIACLANFPNEYDFKIPVDLFGYDMVIAFKHILEILQNHKTRAATPRHHDIGPPGYRSFTS